MWTWDKIYENFTKGAKHPRPQWENLRSYSTEMLVLLPQLELISGENNWQPMLGMGILELLAVTKGTGVTIIREESGMYLLNKFSLATHQVILSHKVKLDELIDALGSMM